MSAAGSDPEPAAAQLPTTAPDGRLRRTLRAEQELDDSRTVGNSVLLSGAGVGDVFIDPEGRPLPLELLIRSYCQRRGLGLVTYRMGAGPLSLPTLADGERIKVSGGERDEHPAQAVRRLLEEVSTAGVPAIVLIDYLDEILPPDCGPDLRLAMLSESIKALTSDVAGWRAQGLQVVMVDRGGGVHPKLANQPGIQVIEVPPPDATEAAIYIRLKQGPRATVPLHTTDDVDADQLGRLSGGLLLRNIAELAALSTPDRPVGPLQISEVKGEVMRQVSNGTLEHIGDAITFDTDVAGLHAVRLLVQQELRKGRRTVQVVLCGPPGTGKSYSARAIAALLGVPLVSFGTILGELMGQSENNMRRALQTLRAQAPICVFMDEVEKGALGASSANGQTGNEAYGDIAAQIFQFSGDVGDDSGVSIVTATNTPTWLDGRTKDRFKFLPVLLASGPELARIMAIQAKRSRVPLVDDLTPLMTAYLDSGRVLSGRSSDELLQSAWNVALDADSDVVTMAHVETALAKRRGTDWTPEAQYSTLTSLQMASQDDRLPWEAARILGEPYPLPAYLQPFISSDGSLDDDKMRRRISELEAAGVYR